MRVSIRWALGGAVLLNLCLSIGTASAEVLKMRYNFETTIEQAPKPTVTEPKSSEPSAETRSSEPSAEPKSSEPSAEPKSSEPSAEPKSSVPSAEPRSSERSAEQKLSEPSAEPKASQPAAELDVAKISMGDSNTGSKGGGERPAVEYKKSETTVTLADDHFFAENADVGSLFDFKKRRVSNFNLKAKTYDEHSLFVYCGFKDLEIRNRAMLSEVLEKVGMADTKASVFDPFDVACELGMIMPDKPDNPGIEVSDRQNGNLLVFTYEGKVIAEAILGDRLDEKFVPMTEKFLIYKTSLHPFVREQIMAKKRSLKFLSYQFRAAMRTYSVKISLLDKSAVGMEPNHFDGYKLTFDKAAALYPVQQKIMLDDKPIELPTRETAFGEAQKLVNTHCLTDAFLTVTEYNLMTGDRAEEDAGDIITEVKDDPNFKIISSCLEPSSKKEAEAALASLQEIKTDGLKKGYMIEIFKANIADSLGLDASKMFLSALAANPHLTGVYNDLGKHYYSRYDSLNAWNSWDLARKVCPTYPMLDSVVKLESRLQRLHPEYF